jgi:uncharacterized membrane protein YbaN (DUF454 family)
MDNQLTSSIISPAGQKMFAVLLLVLGFSMLIYMITVEDEPGTVPLLLIVLGAAWLIKQTRNKNTMHT